MGLDISFKSGQNDDPVDIEAVTIGSVGRLRGIRPVAALVTQCFIRIHFLGQPQRPLQLGSTEAEAGQHMVIARQQRPQPATVVPGEQPYRMSFSM